jgi:hypothetical protein
MTLKGDRGPWLYSRRHKLELAIPSAVGGPLGENDASIGCCRLRLPPRDRATTALFGNILRVQERRHRVS